MVFLLILTLIYFLPTIIARNHGSGSLGFGLLNLFLGITGIGWLVLLLWALLAEPRFCYPAPYYPAPNHYAYNLPPQRYVPLRRY